VEKLEMNSAFWRGKRVLVTGHSGFKGGWLALWLQGLGAKVAGYSLPAPTEPSLFEIARIASGMDSVAGDVRDPAALTKAVKAAAPEIIIHMAAQPIVRQSYADPIETYATNVMGTVNVLEAARSIAGLRAVLIITSDKCYENADDRRFYRENDGLGGSDPYSSSKACAELVTAAYRSSFFNGKSGTAAVASARAGNVIGGGDWAADRLIPDAVRAFSNGERLKLRHPQATRPWQHVLDALYGYLLLAERLCANASRHAEPWNFGPPNDSVMTVADVATAVAKKWGNNAAWEKDGAAGPHEAPYLGVDAGKARAQLGWKPRLEVADAIDWTVDWYRAWRDGDDMRRFSEVQIEQYNSAAKT
jgi:CDP-glucose 4,6-dehydratase